jgi:hypothetical protein
MQTFPDARSQDYTSNDSQAKNKKKKRPAPNRYEQAVGPPWSRMRHIILVVGLRIVRIYIRHVSISINVIR